MYPVVNSVTEKLDDSSFTVTINQKGNRLGLVFLDHIDITGYTGRTFSNFQIDGKAMTQVIKRESNYAGILYSSYVYAMWNRDLPETGSGILSCSVSSVTGANYHMAYFDLYNVDQVKKIIDSHDEAVGFSGSGSADYVHSLSGDRKRGCLAIGGANSMNTVTWSGQSGVVDSYEVDMYGNNECIGGYKLMEDVAANVGWTASLGTRGASSWVLVGGAEDIFAPPTDIVY